MTDENVFIVEDNNDINNLAQNLKLDLLEGDISPPSPDVSINAEIMASSSQKPWATSRRDGAETPTKTQLKRGRPNTPTNGLRPGLKKKYCHEPDQMVAMDADTMKEINSHVAVIVCNSSANFSDEHVTAELAKDLMMAGPEQTGKCVSDDVITQTQGSYVETSFC